MVSALRAAVTDLVATADFDLDAIADVRLAVDEACTSLIRLSNEQTTLVCLAEISAGQLEVTVRTRVAPPRGTFDTDGFGWRVLDALTDSVWFETDAGGEAGQLAIHFVKNASTGR